jgi:hypothetical protein
VEAVHVLGGGDGFNHLVRINVGGQGQLHQDAVDARVIVERIHAGQQFGLGHRGIVLLQHRVQARVGAGLDLVAHVDLAGLVITHQHHGQAGRQSTGLEGSGACGDVAAQLGGQCVAVDGLGGGGGHGSVLK